MRRITILILAKLLTIAIVTLLIDYSPRLATAQRSAIQAGKSGPTRTVAFRYVPAMAIHTLTVAGTFNGWNKSATPLHLQPDGKTWQATLDLAPGIYQYKFVIDDNTWITAPDAPHIDDGNGNVNSQLLLTPTDYSLRPGKLGDGIITTSALLHMPDPDHISRRDEAHFAFLLRTRHDDVQNCMLIVREITQRSGLSEKREKDNTQAVASVPLARVSVDPLYDTWRGVAHVPTQGRYQYAFLLRDGNQSLLYGANGATQSVVTLHFPLPSSRSSRIAARFPFFTLDATRYPTLRVPDWPRDAVFYQIFPERFANGDPTNDGPDVQPWGAKPTFDNRMGGDLAGVRQHLDHLRELGVNALYFNPIFAARSNHGYDTTDYMQVDPRFGTNELLAKLVADCHTRGWHVILDGVFNHTGVDAAPFKSLREEGERSSFRDWYFVKQFPIEVRDGQQTYVGWFGSPWLPKLNLANLATREFMLGVGTGWLLRAKIDGWRLDAADEVSHDYWVDFRRKVRAVNPNAYIVGEIWGDARIWLQGDQFDSVMNYRWRGATLDFFAQDRLSPTGFDRALAGIRDDYPDAAMGVMFNILDSHDTERIRNLCNGNWQRQRQATLFQLTYPGTPCIYYGDEIGMEGGHDPDDRRCMIWDTVQWRNEVWQFYKRALAARRAHPVLRRGDYRTLLADDRTGLYAFTRAYAGEHALIIFNRSDRPQQTIIPLSALGGKWPQDWLPCGATLKQRHHGLLISIPARGVGMFGTLRSDLSTYRTHSHRAGQRPPQA